VRDASGRFGQREGETLTDLLAQRRRTSPTTMMKLAVEGSDDTRGIIACQRGENGGDRPVLGQADGVRRTCDVQVRSTSM